MEGGEFHLPSVKVRATMKDKWGRPHSREAVSEAVNGQLLNVRSEAALTGIRSDIAADFLGHELLIEIAVTHPVNREKKDIIRRIGKPCVEINLRDLNRNISTNDLRNLLLRDEACKRWVSNRWAKKRLKELKKELETVVEKINAGQGPQYSTYPQLKQEAGPALKELPQIGTCLHCGEKTDNWWCFDATTLHCQCRPCYQLGRVSFFSS